jgi:NAD(P) transhydrogenase
MGLLKLLFHRATRKLLGVHCIGETATEIVHIGQSVMAFDGTIDYFRDTVFNYPTMAECYKVAAFDGLNKLDLDEKYEADEDLETLVAREAVELRDATAEVAAV